MGTRPHPRQAAAAAAGGDGAWETRTGPRLTQTCSDTPATARLRRGRPLTTLQPTKRQPATAGAVDRGGRVTTARRTTTRTAPVAATRPHMLAGDALRQLTMHISTSYTAVNPHACCNWPRPEDAHAAARLPPHPHASPHLTNNDGLRWKTDGRPPANGPPTTAPQQRRHSPSTPARGPSRPPTPRTQPTAAATTQLRGR